VTDLLARYQVIGQEYYSPTRIPRYGTKLLVLRKLSRN